MEFDHVINAGAELVPVYFNQSERKRVGETSNGSCDKICDCKSVFVSSIKCNPEGRLLSCAPQCSQSFRFVTGFKQKRSFHPPFLAMFLLLLFLCETRKGLALAQTNTTYSPPTHSSITTSNNDSNTSAQPTTTACTDIHPDICDYLATDGHCFSEDFRDIKHLCCASCASMYFFL